MLDVPDALIDAAGFFGPSKGGRPDALGVGIDNEDDAVARISGMLFGCDWFDTCVFGGGVVSSASNA